MIVESRYSLRDIRRDDKMSTLNGKTLESVHKVQGTKNYDVWAMKAIQLLIRKDLYDAIDFTNKDKADKSSCKKDCQTRTTIIFTLDNAILEHAKSATIAKKLWETPKGLFNLAEFSTHYFLLQKLVKISLKSHELITKFVEAIKRQSCQLKELDPIVSE